MAWSNVDHDCAKTALASLASLDAKGAKKATGIVEKALACLALQGPYAMSCFLVRQKDAASTLRDQSRALLQTHLPLQPQADTLGKHLKEIADDFDKLLFARRLLGQMLTYARYELKGRE